MKLDLLHSSLGTHVKATRGRREENTNTVPSETEMPEALDHKIGGGSNKSTEVQRRVWEDQERGCLWLQIPGKKWPSTNLLRDCNTLKFKTIQSKQTKPSNLFATMEQI